MEFQEVEIELDAIVLARRAGEDRVRLLTRARSALERAEGLRTQEFKIVATLRVAELLNDLERTDEAFRILEPLRSMSRFADHRHGVSVIREMVRAKRMAGDWEAVDELASLGIDTVERLRAKVSAPQMASAYLRFSAEIYSAGVEASFRLGRIEEALGRAERAKCRSVNRMRAGDEQEPKALREKMERISREIDGLRARGMQPSPKLLAERRATWDRVAMARYPRWTDVPGVKAAQDALPADAAVVYWFWIDRHRFLVGALDRKEIVAEIVTVTEDERNSLDRHAELVLSYRGHGESSLKARVPNGLLLTLFPDGIRGLIDRHPRIILSPHRVLHGLPIHMVNWGETQRILLLEKAVSYAPNLAVLAEASVPLASPLRPVLFVGVSSRSPTLPPDGPLLAKESAQDLAAIYDTDELTVVMDRETGELASWAEGPRLSKFQVLHFACHGLSLDSDNPMESRLLLYDSDLDALEISSWRLDSEVVVLSACYSGQRSIEARGLDELPGDDLFGLQAAFFAAGSRRVLGNLWPVNIKPAREVTTLFHKHLKHEPADVALFKAFHDYFESTPAALRQPHQWACMFLVHGARLGKKGMNIQ